MDASQVADLIVSSVKKSKLNFHIQESPFSLFINLRKTFIKDTNGNSLQPLGDIFGNENIVDNKVKVEEEEKVSSLNDSLEKREAELNKARKALHELNIKLEKAKNEITEAQFNANKSAKEVDKQRAENKTLKLKNDELHKDIETLNTAIKNLKVKENEIKRLETQNNKLEEQVKKKKAENKSLLDENENICYEKSNLEAQLVSLRKPKNIHKSTSTSTAVKIEAQTQTEIEPTFFPPQIMETLSIRSHIESLSSSDISPTDPGPASSDKQCSHKCDHKPQCILREPRPPPSPTITFLYNERSKYHQHMMLWSKKEFEGHSRCFAVENENYGCDDCTWLKWWYKWHGENHGFPDIPEWIYKKYL